MTNRGRGSFRSFRVQRPCRFYSTPRGCQYGDICKFSHDGTHAAATGNSNEPHRSQIQPSQGLRDWKYMLDPSAFGLISSDNMNRLFILAESLVGQDPATMQETVRGLADESGLGLIKQMLDRNIPAAVDDAPPSLWSDQIYPFFRLLSNPTVSQSAILEQQVATITNFVVGPGASRLKGLFFFVCHVLENMKAEGDERFMPALVCVLSVFAILVDCSTSNLVNDKFPHIALRLSSFVDLDADDELLGYHVLKARRHLKYILLRLKVGQEIPSAGAAAKAPALRATFTLEADLPGSLSRHGPRHDNDHASIADINILPSSEEIASARAEYWPTIDPDQSHVQGEQWVLDRGFRLLREDTVGQLRDVSRAEVSSIRATGHNVPLKPNNLRRMFRYSHATVKRFNFDRSDGLTLVVSFRQPDDIPKGANSRKLWWEHSRRLQRDAMVCILNGSGDAIFSTVVANQDQRDQDKKKEEQQDQETISTAKKDEFSLWNHEIWANVSLKFTDVTAETLKWAASWHHKRSGYVFVEFPGILLPTFRPTLKALQKMSLKPDIPFIDLITPQNTGGKVIKIPPPEYTCKPGFRFNLKCLTKDKEDLWHSSREPAEASAVSNRTGLDQTQALAVLNSLDRCLSLVKGPPGTGKSFTGGAIIQTLVYHKETAGLGPILCVTYTNHALDQVLEHLHRDGIKNIIRVGARSESEVLKNVNLRNVATNTERTKNEKTRLWEAYRDIEASKSSALGAFPALATAGKAAQIKFFLERHLPERHRILFPEADEDGFTQANAKTNERFDSWLCGGKPSKKPRTEKELEQVPLDDMAHEERTKIVDLWIQEIHRPQLIRIKRAQDEWQSAKDTQDAVHREIKARCLKQADVIGVTTSGLASNLDLFRSIQSKVLICEEAGEVLEPHLLTALLPSIQHAVFIGDHLQLRPQIANYELQSTHHSGRRFSFDVSLFERLVKPFSDEHGPLPFTTLQTQRRMHPLISELIRPTVYPDLEDADQVKSHPEVAGMKKRVFWLHHENSEKGRHHGSGLGTSHTNPFEVDLAASLVSHLFRQGTYANGEIAVLTPYKGQLRLLQNRLGAMYEVSLNERDQEALEADGESDALPGPSVAKVQVSANVRIATIDNFQGEEAKVVIISLVRSNSERKVGFLKTPNRINVLLSRAQHGMYVLGDAVTASTVPMWAQVIDILKQGDNYGDRLELQCPRHPDTKIEASEPDHFLQFAPDGGCLIPCDKRLKCGHSCTGPCHSDVVHNAVKCLEQCQRPKTGCEHECRKVCGDPCDVRCNEIVSHLDITWDCGHHVYSATYWQAQDPTKYIKCDTKVPKKSPNCGHTFMVECFQEVNWQNFKCATRCGSILPCGHACKRACSQCKTVRDEMVVREDHGVCTQVCGRNYTTCQHSCRQKCHGEIPCQPCNSLCEARCSHSRCPKPCSEPCAPCAESICESKCPHSACTMPCAAPCDRVPCSKRCEKVLSCGHQCPSFCGEACPNAKFCQICCDEATKSSVVDMLLMQSYSDIDLEETPCIFLDCGHFFTGETLDGHLAMTKYYEMNSEGAPVAILAPLEPFTVESAKACPTCRSSLRNIPRYGRIVRGSLLDEATKKFISWSTREYAQLGEALVDAREKLEDKKTQWLGEVHDMPQELTLSGSRNSQIRSITETDLMSCFSGLRSLRHRVKQHLKKVQREEQPLQRVADLVRFAQKHRAVEGHFAFDLSVIQTKGYLQTFSLLLRLDSLILMEVVDLAADELKVVLRLDLEQNRSDALKLITFAQDSARPFEEVEGWIYSAQVCALQCRSGPLATESMTDDPEVNRSMRDEAAKCIAHARTLQEKYPSTAPLGAEIDAIERTLRDGPFYTAVSLEEKRLAFRAMQEEFRGTGHWYTCRRGHYFTVGECGLPMEQTRCPECGGPVGGQGHEPAEGVSGADDMDALASGMARLGA